jgi:DNA invertase Pin-like site-specific DNA recombinase
MIYRGYTVAEYVSYLRVSTDKQGIEGYGIDAQRLAVMPYAPAREFVEVESGKRKDRPELMNALAYCKKNKIKLVVAKLDRLARNVAFVSALMESKVGFVAADFPEANDLTVHIISAVAEHEAKMISARTKAGLAAAKVKGVKLGVTMNTDKQGLGRTTQAEIADRNAFKVRGTITSLKAGGASLRVIAGELNRMGVTTPRGKQWTATAVKNALERR